MTAQPTFRFDSGEEALTAMAFVDGARSSSSFPDGAAPGGFHGGDSPSSGSHIGGSHSGGSHSGGSQIAGSDGGSHSGHFHSGHSRGEGSPARPQAPPSRVRQAYLRVLGLVFALFSSVRIFTYLPTIWAIHASGDSSQYSLWTWGTWIGANASMAAWLFENNGRRLDSASVVSAGNALMCALTSLSIAYYRF